jgi:hypothetical protein
MRPATQQPRIVLKRLLLWPVPRGRRGAFCDLKIQGEIFHTRAS